MQMKTMGKLGVVTAALLLGVSVEAAGRMVLPDGRCLGVVAAEALCVNSPDGVPVSECAVVYCVTNGERLATASIGSVNADFMYEPGSVIKPFTAVSAMENGVARMDTLYATNRDDPKYEQLPGDGSHQWDEKMSVSDALVHSSNIVFGKLGVDVGMQNLLSTFSGFGIGAHGNSLPRTDRIDKASMSRIPIGQGVSSTLDEMARAYVILANHGVSPWTGKQVVSKDSADAVALALRRVVAPEGTARRAAVPGVTVAGKTGTSSISENGRFVPGCYNATFIGFFPAENPVYVIAVLAQNREPQAMHQGGHYPAMAFAHIVKAMSARK